MKFYSRSQFINLIKELVKEQIDIVEVISQYVQLSNSKSGLCPFHDDHNPSLNVNQSEQYFYCFGCRMGGDVITFIREIENLSFIGALQYLVDQFGIDLSSLEEDNTR